MTAVEDAAGNLTLLCCFSRHSPLRKIHTVELHIYTHFCEMVKPLVLWSALFFKQFGSA